MRTGIPGRGIMTWSMLFVALGCVETRPIERSPESFGFRVFEPVDVDETAPQSFTGLKVEDNQSDSLDELEYFPGVRVVDIVENSPAEQAGIRLEDVILAVDGESVNDREAFETLLESLEPGRTLTLEIDRQGAVHDRPLEVASSGSVEREIPDRYHVERVKLRCKVRSAALSAEDSSTPRPGVVIVEVLPRSPLEELGLGPGDLLLSLDDRAIESGADLLRRLNRDLQIGQEVQLTYQKGTSQSTETIALWEPDRELTELTIPILFSYESDPIDDRVEVEILDLFILSLFRYESSGPETHYRFLSLFGFSTGEGELSQVPATEDSP